MVIGALVLAAALPWLDVDNTSRLLLVIVAVILGVVWWNSSFAPPVHASARAAGRPQRSGRAPGRAGHRQHGQGRPPLAPLASCSDGLQRSGFEQPPPDLQKLIAAWEQFEAGEESPGKVLANLKTAGLPEVLRQLAESGWVPS